MVQSYDIISATQLQSAGKPGNSGKIQKTAPPALGILQAPTHTKKHRCSALYATTVFYVENALSRTLYTRFPSLLWVFVSYCSIRNFLKPSKSLPISMLFFSPFMKAASFSGMATSPPQMLSTTPLNLAG